MDDDCRTSLRPLAMLAVALAGVMFVFPLAVRFPLLDPDEGLHASIAQEMVERGNWVTPHFLGRPFLDKPIFYFWVQAASLWLFGPSEAAVRKAAELNKPPVDSIMEVPVTLLPK